MKLDQPPTLIFLRAVFDLSGVPRKVFDLTAHLKWSSDIPLKHSVLQWYNISLMYSNYIYKLNVDLNNKFHVHIFFII